MLTNLKCPQALLVVTYLDIFTNFFQYHLLHFFHQGFNRWFDTPRGILLIIPSVRILMGRQCKKVPFASTYLVYQIHFSKMTGPISSTKVSIESFLHVVSSSIRPHQGFITAYPSMVFQISRYSRKSETFRSALIELSVS